MFLLSEVVEEQGEERESEDAELKPSKPKKQRIERRWQKSRVMEGEDQSQSQEEEDGSGLQQSEDEGKRELDQGVQIEAIIKFPPILLVQISKPERSWYLLFYEHNNGNNFVESTEHQHLLRVATTLTLARYV